MHPRHQAKAELRSCISRCEGADDPLYRELMASVMRKYFSQYHGEDIYLDLRDETWAAVRIIQRVG
jgi:hypothetical protein